MQELFLDNHTVTAIEPQILKAAEPYLYETSAHCARYGSHEDLIEEAEAKLKATLNAQNDDRILFCHSAQEAHRYLFEALFETCILQEGKSRIIVSARESLESMQTLLRFKRQHPTLEIVRLRYTQQGIVDVDHLAKLIDERCAFVSILSADDESGAIQPVEEIATLCQSTGVPFHTDATYAVGKIPQDVRRGEITYLTLDARTLHSPLGGGALYIRAGDVLLSTLYKDRTKRLQLFADYPPIASIAALAKAVEIASDMIGFEMESLREIRDDLAERLEEIEGVEILVPRNLRLPNTLAFTLEGVSSDFAVRLLAEEGVYLNGSVSSLCANPLRLPLIDAMQHDTKLRHSVLSVALSHFNEDDDLEIVADSIENKLLPLRYQAISKEVL